MGQERLRPEESTPTLLTLSVTYGDTDADTVCGPLRFIAYRTPKDREREVAYYREQGERLLSRAFSKPLRTEYHCREDAEAAVSWGTWGTGCVTPSPRAADP